MKRLALVLLLFAVSAQAQISFTATRRFSKQGSAPATCTTGDVYYNTATAVANLCIAANTWTVFSVAAGTTYTGNIVLPNGLTSAAALQLGGVTTGLYSSGANTFRLLAAATVIQTIAAAGTTFNMGILPSGDFTLDSGSAAARWRNTHTGRLLTGAATSTCSVSGAGSTATCVVNTGSSDLGTLALVTANGAGIAALGTITVTYSVATAYGTNPPVTVAMLANSSGTWNARASIIGASSSTTNSVFNWDNNAVVLTSGSAYLVHVISIGK